MDEGSSDSGGDDDGSDDEEDDEDRNEEEGEGKAGVRNNHCNRNTPSNRFELEVIQNFIDGNIMEFCINLFVTFFSLFSPKMVRRLPSLTRQKSTWLHSEEPSTSLYSQGRTHTKTHMHVLCFRVIMGLFITPPVACFIYVLNFFESIHIHVRLLCILIL